MKRSSDFEHRQDLVADLIDACAMQAVEGEIDWRRAEARRPGDAAKWRGRTVARVAA